MEHIIGIDPGVSGCILVADGYGAHTWLLIDTGDAMSVANELRSIKAATPHIGKVVIERTHTMPMMGRASCFTFGEATGVLRGACAAYSLPVVRLSAQVWQKVALQGRGIPKERPARMALIVEASMERFPTLEWPKSKKDREAVSSALWLAEVGRDTIAPRGGR